MDILQGVDPVCLMISGTPYSSVGFCVSVYSLYFFISSHTRRLCVNNPDCHQPFLGQSPDSMDNPYLSIPCITKYYCDGVCDINKLIILPCCIHRFPHTKGVSIRALPAPAMLLVNLVLPSGESRSATRNTHPISALWQGSAGITYVSIHRASVLTMSPFHPFSQR